MSLSQTMLTSFRSCNFWVVVLVVKIFHEIFLGFLWCFRVFDVVEHLVVRTSRESVQHFAHSLFPCREVLVCWLGRYPVCSFDLTPVVVPQQVLVHLVGPRRIVASVELLRQKRGCHASIHFFFCMLLPVSRVCLWYNSCR